MAGGEIVVVGKIAGATALRPEFWPTVAAVLPVLALAIVVEARAVAARWTHASPMRWVKTFHGILWVTPLALSVYVEDSAFSFLEGIKVPHAAVSLVGYTVSLSLSVLIISPGMELLMRSNARSIARAVVAIDRAEIRYYKRRKMRRARKDLRDLERLRKRTVEMSARLTLKALEVGSDIQLSANEVRRQQGVLDNWRHEMYETRREITEYEQKIRDFLATTNKSGKSLEDSLNAEYLSRIEAAIMRMDYELPQPEPRKSDETGS